MSKLFDDESDEEYQAQPATQETAPVEQPATDYQQPAQQEEYNPYLAQPEPVQPA
jgi:hypothetical protein